MFVSKNVVYVVCYKNMYSEMEVKAFKTAFDAAEWIDTFSERFLAEDAEMKMLVEPVLTSEKIDD